MRPVLLIRAGAFVAATFLAVPLILSAVGPSKTKAADLTLALAPQVHASQLGSVHSITATTASPTPNVLVRFRVSSGPNSGITAAALTNGQRQAVFFYLGDGGVGTDVIVAFLDLDRDGVIDPGEDVSVATIDWLNSSLPTALQLSPDIDSHRVGMSHQLTATVQPAAGGWFVRFQIVSGPDVGMSSSANTDAAGAARWAYAGNRGVGTDVILAWVDLDEDAVRDPDEPLAVAQVTWTSERPVSSIAVSPSVDANVAGATHSVTATVTPRTVNVPLWLAVISGPNAGETRATLTDRDGQGTMSYAGAGGTGTDTIHVWADFDNDGIRDADEPWASVTKTWYQVTIPIEISATPRVATNSVSTRHRISATVSPAVSRTLVRFEVQSGPNAGDRFSAYTNVSGVASASYLGDGGAGTDVILVWADLDNDGRLDSTEPASAVTKIWTTDDSHTSLVRRVHAVCAALTRTDHPSLRTLCRVFDQVPPTAQRTIGSVILRKAEGWGSGQQPSPSRQRHNRYHHRHGDRDDQD